MKLEYNLDQVLKDKKLNMSQAAKLCGITYPTLLGIVKNTHTRIDLLTISKLVDGLNIEISELFRDIPS